MADVLRIGHVDLARGYSAAEQQTFLLIRNLAQLGVEQYLLCRDDSQLIRKLKGTPYLKIFKVHGVSFFAPLNLTPEMLLRLAMEEIYSRHALSLRSNCSLVPAEFSVFVIKPSKVFAHRVDGQAAEAFYRHYKPVTPAVVLSRVERDRHCPPHA